MAVKTIIQPFVISKLDHCNCLLQESPSPLLYRLQNMYHAARIISHARKRDHITHSGWAALAAYKTAHWLQNPTVHSQRIDWLGPCLSDRPPYRANKHYLDRPWTSSKTYGDRVFMSVAPRPWNWTTRRHPEFQIPWSFQDQPQHSLISVILLSKNTHFPSLGLS